MKVESISVSSHFADVPDLTLYIVPEIGSAKHDNYRELLRLEGWKMLAQQFPTLHASSPNDQLSHEHLSISVSHCRSASLLGWVAQPYTIGVDIEELSRLNLALVHRVGHFKEIARAPDPLLLWSAKEAVFKTQSAIMKVISSVEVFDWLQLDQSRWLFKARSSLNKSVIPGKGEICLTLEHSCAFFVADH